MASDSPKDVPGLWGPDYSVPAQPVRQHFRYEHPALAALVEYGILFSILLCFAVVIRRLWTRFYAHRIR